MRTPQAVKDAAKFLTDCYAAKYNHLGQYNGYEVYTLYFFEEEAPLIGLPEIYLYKEGEEVITLHGFEVFGIMDEAVRNTRERRRAARQAKIKGQTD